MTQQFIVFVIVAVAAAHVAWRAMPKRWQHAMLARAVDALKRCGVMNAGRADRLTAAVAARSGPGCAACSSCGGCSKNASGRGSDAFTST